MKAQKAITKLMKRGAGSCRLDVARALRFLIGLVAIALLVWTIETANTAAPNSRAVELKSGSSAPGMPAADEPSAVAVPAAQTFGSCGGGIHAINPSACIGPVNTVTGAFLIQPKLGQFDQSIEPIGGSEMSNLHQLYVAAQVYRQDEGAFPNLLIGYGRGGSSDPTVGGFGQITVVGENLPLPPTLVLKGRPSLSNNFDPTPPGAISKDNSLMFSVGVEAYPFIFGLIFNHGETFAPTSTGTPFPIVSGTVDTDGLIPDYGEGQTILPLKVLVDITHTYITPVRFPALARFYNSADPSPGALGPGWSHSLATRLEPQGDGSVLLYAEDGQQVLYPVPSRGVFLKGPGVRSSLFETADGYELVRHDQVRYRFDRAGKLLRREDRNRQGYSLAYDDRGSLARVTTDTGRTLDFTHDASGLLTAVTLDDGRTTRYSYSEGRLVSVTDPRGGLTRYEYDSNHRLTRVIDQNGDVAVSASYYPEGRVMEVRDALGNQTNYSYDVRTQTTTAVDPRGNEWRDIYAGNVLVSRADPLGAEVQLVRDEQLNPVRITDARGFEHNMSYDDRGNLLRWMAPPSIGSSVAFTYNERNDVVSATDARGATARYTYDERGNLTAIADRAGETTTIGRDAVTGHPTSVTDPLRRTTTFTYDARSRLVSVARPSGAATHFSYDDSDRLVSATDPNGRTWRYGWDAGNNLVSVADPLRNSVRFEYDPRGALVRHTDALTRATAYAYDAAGRLVRRTSPDGTETTFGYDASGNLISITDPLGRMTTRAYDPANRVAVTRTPAGRERSFSYDESGNLTRVTDPARRATDFTYDALGRLIAIDYANPTTPDVSVTYDENSNRVSMSDGHGVTTYAYDVRDRLLHVEDPLGTIAYERDAAGQVVRRTYPASIVDYAYDSDGRMAEVRGPDGHTSYAYDASGRVTQSTSPASRTQYAYDAAGRLVQVRSETPAGIELTSFTYALDAVGNPISRTTAQGTTRYAYDALDRLTSEEPPGQIPTSYAYDAAGNRIRKTEASGTTSYAYDDDDRLIQEIAPGKRPGSPPITISYTNDESGNRMSRITRGERTEFAYDQANRLVAVDPPRGPRIAYGYSGDGVLVQREMRSKITDFLLDPLWPAHRVAEERETPAGGEDRERQYVLGLGGDPISITSSRGRDRTLYYHRDGFGSVVLITRVDGEVFARFDYDYFGVLTEDLSKKDSNRLLFLGQRFEPAAGLYFFGSVGYDPSAGQVMGSMTDLTIPNFIRYQLRSATTPPKVLIPQTARCLARCWISGE